MTTLCQISGFGRTRMLAHNGRWKEVLCTASISSDRAVICWLESHSLAGHRAAVGLQRGERSGCLMIWGKDLSEANTELSVQIPAAEGSRDLRRTQSGPTFHELHQRNPN